MYAVVQTGGKQYKVFEGDKIQVEKLEADIGSSVSLDKVLMIGSADPVKIGTPTVANASVSCEVVEQGRHDKILVFKKKRRKRYYRSYGHRQPFTTLKVTSIVVSGVTSKGKRPVEPHKAPVKRIAKKQASAAVEGAKGKAATPKLSEGKETISKPAVKKKPTKKGL